MRSSGWQYFGYVLVAVGSTLVMSGIIASIYLREHSWTNPQYSSYPIPMVIVGIFIIATGIAAFFQFAKERRKEVREDKGLIPPPPLPPPPPPPNV